MTFRVRMVVYNAGGAKATREVVTKFAGCADASDARTKARRYYEVAQFKSVEPVKAEE
jgi:hypothetical protein